MYNIKSVKISVNRIKKLFAAITKAIEIRIDEKNLPPLDSSKFKAKRSELPLRKRMRVKALL